MSLRKIVGSSIPNDFTDMPKIFNSYCTPTIKCNTAFVAEIFLSLQINSFLDSLYMLLTVLQIRYAEHLPSVLKSISCTFPGQNKVGVVGRTGSGKSTLIQALFRIVEPREGSIIIDGVDICKIGLYDLRSRLSIIPQDPTMFEGTVRGNLDPLEQYSDSDVWEVINYSYEIAVLEVAWLRKIKLF